MDTLSLPTEKVVLLSACRSRPPFSHSLVMIEPEASQRRSVELRSSIRTAAGPRMTAPVIDAAATSEWPPNKHRGKKESVKLFLFNTTRLCSTKAKQHEYI